ncbi:tRNA sulfurtransferase [Arsenophonus endosymbiont of Aleurodicus dispersus]|uniref:tRNA uracil 4-sulfurtransferase ThiI n=1 Tax=Arsenophonus endosymbiont of Aleurodicus dispersus TaxID=235559 RepID=UPI000EAB8349|nr:tRNA uracil 4-sulfurtransferase ThiI [Arsenophonus endosymbiont of Aleurodicus dispersus]VAY02147.1 tRNA sulfurtransferase [Arsenophonus endosymbiont of Aleurodicus dispersus]
MKFIIKLFPEITIKSHSVRLRFINILANNILNILKVLDTEITVIPHWDNIEVHTKKNTYHDEICDALTRIPGIHHILLVEQYQFRDIHHILKLAYATYAKLLTNKTFCVRVKRRGKHDFTSIEVERYVGGGLNKHILSAKVKLNKPDITVNIEIENDKVILVKSRIQGIGGFPIGTQEDVLSLISGGFDSAVSSYMLMRRGCRVHYCFFNLGGASHDICVKQVAYHLWYRFSSSHKVRFVAIDFAPIVSEILKKIEYGQVGVVLKRMMLRAASMIVELYGVQALVTGESLGQVSSQTLTNLRVIDNVTDTLILRPLIAYDKANIINIARKIGTEDFARTMPEFCELISKKPTVKVVKSKIEAQETNFDFTLIDQVVSTAKKFIFHQKINDSQNDSQYETPSVEVVTTFSVDDIVLDIRAPDEQEARILKLEGVKVELLPFYKLKTKFGELPQEKTYLLYCERGIMSRLQALYLHEQGFKNVKVYCP